MNKKKKIFIGSIAGLLVALLVVLGVLGSIAPAPVATPVTVEGGEIVELRSRTSKTYDLGDNKYALDASIGSVHYQDELGDWQEINNEWVTVSDPWDWEMTQDGYHAYALERFTDGQIMLFGLQGEEVAFQPMALEWTNNLDQIEQISMPQNILGVVSNEPVEILPGMQGSVGNIRWDDGYGTGSHFEWETQPSRLSKKLILDSSPSAPPQFIIDGGNPALRLNFIFDASAGLDIYVNDALWDKKSRVLSANTTEFRKDGETLWGFTPAAYWDSGEGEDGVGYTELRKVGNSLYVSVRVPYEWLQTAVYPVYIDPTIEEQVGADLDDVHELEGNNSVYDVADEVRHTSSTDVWSRQWGAHRWTSASFPVQGDTIDVAYVDVDITSTSYDDANFNMHFELAAAPAQFTTSTGDVTDRPRTSASTSWIEDGCGKGAEQSPSLVTPLQEVVDDYTPTAIALICRPNQDASKAFTTTPYNDNPVKGAKLHIEYTAAANTILLQVSANLDDVHEVESSGAIEDSAIWIKQRAGTTAISRHWGGHRWVSGSLPSQGDTIDIAYAQLYVYDTAYDDVNGNWHFEKAASPAQFTTTNYDVTDRTRTTASDSWIADSLGVGWHQTPSLVAALQEVIDNYSPTTLVLIFRPNQDAAKSLYTRSHNYDAGLAARIYIKWTPAAAAEGHSYGTIIG